MARTPADPVARLEIIAASREKTKPDERVSADPMAKLLGLSWVSLRAMLTDDPAFPVVKRGSEGVPWVFDVHAVLDHVEAWCRREIEARAAKQQRLADLAGVVIAPTNDALTVGELVQINTVQMQVQRRRIEQREFVPRAEAAGVIADLFLTLQTELLSTTSREDPAGMWPAEVRESVDQSHRSLLVRLHDLVEPWTRNDPRSEAAA